MELQEVVTNCEGNEARTLQNGEKVCTLIFPDFNDTRAHCRHQAQKVIRDMGIGIEKYQQVYLCNKK